MQKLLDSKAATATGSSTRSTDRRGPVRSARALTGVEARMEIDGAPNCVGCCSSSIWMSSF
jgi:hypothetical protein